MKEGKGRVRFRFAVYIVHSCATLLNAPGTGGRDKRPALHISADARFLNRSSSANRVGSSGVASIWSRPVIICERDCKRASPAAC